MLIATLFAPKHPGAVAVLLYVAFCHAHQFAARQAFGDTVNFS
jgi:hypothetical protein